ncbi:MULTISPECIES: hypothetical protein [unclassified Streptomyces]|uniref:hypothetical protein n=1 Tax=unclassified Streptomyces TaxID=2593676 RepID=UPI002E27BE52|nr:hypothetical protein [Streptomyces sp. NBC_01423]WSX89180.1 hypothetical protein OH827_00870 [Streptomyces sp. NBC_00891]WSY03659.1 hypothetical protein OG464_00870 [Streptomyces sp. NBC_00890]WSZ05285.1 hypothetical protein OG704_00870 [Streptomyces sp. NBC_00869]WSZ27219.1 hypothetical protein OG498_32695 [Streptomyces sp. NBC_00870]
MARSTGYDDDHRSRKATGAWFVPPLLVFFVGAMLTSVISHAVDGGTYTAVMCAGFALDAIAVIWAVVRRRRFTS